jgi:NADP-dependent 3-hydroxy acid dehydrogenase YdfG
LKAEHGVQVKYVQLDVTDENSILSAKAFIEKEEGKLDVLVNNAGRDIPSRSLFP